MRRVWCPRVAALDLVSSTPTIVMACRNGVSAVGIAGIAIKPQCGSYRLAPIHKLVDECFIDRTVILAPVSSLGRKPPLVIR